MTVEIIHRRMLESAPEQYELSDVYKQLQLTIAEELNLIARNVEDLEAQRDIQTATWGLEYWELSVGLPISTASYQVRRSNILARLRTVGNFSAELIKNVASAYTQGDVSVAINFETGVITVTYIDDFPNTDDFRYKLEEIVHAHLTYDYQSRIFERIEFKTVVDHINTRYNTETSHAFFGLAIPGSTYITLNGSTLLNGATDLSGVNAKTVQDAPGTLRIIKNNVVTEEVSF